jgi:AFG1-like ATPase
MMLGRVLTELLSQGVVLVATSNVDPDRLYKGGIYRELFLPFVARWQMRDCRRIARILQRDACRYCAWVVPRETETAIAFMAASSLVECARHGHSGQADFTGFTLEWLCRTADRADPPRVFGPYRRFWRGPSTPDPAILHALLQRHQNASVIGQRCAGLSSGSADRKHQNRSPSSADSNTTMSGFKFSVHTGNRLNTASCCTL